MRAGLAASLYLSAFFTTRIPAENEAFLTTLAVGLGVAGLVALSMWGRAPAWGRPAAIAACLMSLAVPTSPDAVAAFLPPVFIATCGLGLFFTLSAQSVSQLPEVRSAVGRRRRFAWNIFVLSAAAAAPSLLLFAMSLPATGWAGNLEVRGTLGPLLAGLAVAAPLLAWAFVSQLVSQRKDREAKA